MINLALLLLKWFLLCLLYIFLIVALFVIYKDLKKIPEAAAKRESGEEPHSKLVVLESPGEKAGKAFFIDGQALIGRTPECDIRISDNSVSHQHARISQSRRAFKLEDLESKNGTFLNHRKITRSALLKQGDLIKVGKTTLEFME